MLKVDDYVRQAEQNSQFVVQVSLERFDWQITVCFYAALHWLNAVTRLMGKPEAHSHEQTFNNVKEARIPYPVRQAYEDLFDLSIYARYRCMQLEDLKDLAAESKDLLSVIERYARGILRV
jgi:hypothetical protein